jgi:hypothetical protein
VELAHAPAFLWLLRDFQLQLRDGERQLAPRDYIEEVLGQLAGSGANVANSNQVGGGRAGLALGAGPAPPHGPRPAAGGRPCPAPCTPTLHTHPPTLPPTPSAAPHTQMRAVIKEVFPERDGFTLVRPVLEEAQLARLETLPPSQLRPEFRKVRRVCAAVGVCRCRCL